MTNFFSIASLTVLLGTAACNRYSRGPFEPGGGIFLSGNVQAVDRIAPDGVDLNNVTVAARDVGGDGTIVNSQLYANIEQGFTLDLPGGHYDIEVTDAAHNVIATYEDVIVDGDVTLHAPTAIAR